MAKLRLGEILITRNDTISKLLVITEMSRSEFTSVSFCSTRSLEVKSVNNNLEKQFLIAMGKILVSCEMIFVYAISQNRMLWVSKQTRQVKGSNPHVR